MPAPKRIFLLSPAHVGGKRASYVIREGATFELARKIRTPAGATIGETFSFLSGLYFRGKVAYADYFAKPPKGLAGSWTITTNRGLVETNSTITVDDLKAMGEVDVHLNEPRYRQPLEQTARVIAECHSCDVILLGSVASGKYVDVLLEIFGDRLRFPNEFAGRGDMSRGALMLRCVRDQTELEYVKVEGAFRGLTHKKRRKK